MEAGTKTDDIHTILSRFNNWSGKQNGDRAEHLDDGVGEIPYEEAMRRVRSRVRAANQAATRATTTEPAKSALTITEADPAPVTPMARGDAAIAGAEEVVPVGTAVQALESLLKASTARTAPVKKGRAKAGLKGKPRAMAAIAELLPADPARNATVKAATQAPKKRNAVKAVATTPTGAKRQEFRQVLTKSVRRGEPAARVTNVKAVQRKEWVSVPLSSGEKVRLRQCAAIAGVTVPVYLRMRALGMDVMRSETRMPATAETPQAVAESMSLEESQRRSGFGDWIALLRNRFLTSPVRFAERA